MKKPFTMISKQTISRAQMMQDEVAALASHFSCGDAPTYVCALSLDVSSGIVAIGGQEKLTPAQAETMAKRLELEAAALRRLAA